MLVLVLSVVTVDGASPPHPLSATFPASGGSIGRDESNTLVLPDSFNRVSRVHAAVSFPAGYATISNASVTLPLRVGDSDLAYRESVLVTADGNIEIGPYVICAEFVERSAKVMTSGPTTEVHFDRRSERRTAVAAVRLSAAIGLTDSAAVAHAPPVRDFLSANAVLAPAGDLAAVTPVPTVPLTSTKDTPVDPLTAAFLEGARLPPNACGAGLTAETAEVIGTCLRAATAGAIDLLAARAITKFQVQADVTTFAEQANNPFKFMHDADAVILLALGKKVPGFMRPDTAMRATFADLRAHEAGVIAGTRAAVVAALERFSPDTLTTELASDSVAHRLLPSKKRAQLWDAYDAHYQGIVKHAEQDFYGVFGAAFLDAYREETQREAKLVAMRKASAEKSG